MLICPKCRNEYRDGIEKCADCGCALEPVREGEKYVPLLAGNQASVEQLKKYLEYNKLNGVQVLYDGARGVHVLAVKEADADKAKKYANNFMQQETLRMQQAMMAQQMQAGAFSVQADEEEKPVAAEVKNRKYMDNKERAAENRSSAWTLLLVGGVGLLVVVLGFFGVLPFNVSGPSRIMVYGMMGAMFLLFIVMGFVSFKKSKTYADQAKEDNELESTLKDWCRQAFENGRIDTMLGMDLMGASEEELYFKRTAAMKMMIKGQFVNLDDTFIEHFVDEIYDELFK